MTVELVKDIFGEMFKTLMLVSSPALFVSLFVGLLVGFFQTITQIQEFTLTFVPKIISVFACLFILATWISNILITFTTNLIENIPLYIK
jgi:flagellar biosynthetic protein FliQ